MEFEGTLVLEKLAEIGKGDEFYEAVDSDDFERAIALMKKAGVDEESINQTVKMMKDADDNH